MYASTHTKKCLVSRFFQILCAQGHFQLDVNTFFPSCLTSRDKLLHYSKPIPYYLVFILSRLHIASEQGVISPSKGVPVNAFLELMSKC